MGMPDFKEGKVKSRTKTGKTVIFSGKSGTIVPILPWKDTSPLFIHSWPRLPFLLSKMSQKYKKNYNFDIFLHFPKFAPLLLPNFGKNSKFDNIPYVYIIEV